MRLTAATEAFIADLRAEGRISSDHTELSYRTKLNALADETGNRDPKLIGRDDLKRASVETTAREYTDRVSLDELSANVTGFSYGLTRETREVERDG